MEERLENILEQAPALDAELEEAWQEQEREEGAVAGKEETPRQPVQPDSPQEQPGQQREAPGTDQSLTFTLKHLGETRTVDREEVVRLAQQGLDYQRVKAERDRLRAAYRPDSPQPGEQAGQENIHREQMRQEDMSRFLSRYPQVRPEDIPPQVWEAVRQGESLTAAYALHRASELERQLAAQRKNQENLRKAVGSLSTLGTQVRDEISCWWDEE